MFVLCTISSSLTIQTSSITKAATGLVNCGFCKQGKRRGGEVVEVNCTAQQVESPTLQKESLSLKQVDTCNRDQLVLHSSHGNAGLSSTSLKSACHQLEISLHQLRQLPKELDLLSDGQTSEELLHRKELPSSSGSDSSAATNMSTGTHLPRQKKIWQGARKPRRKPPQPPWTPDDFQQKATLILDTIVAESESESLVEEVLDSWLGKITRVELTKLIKDLGFQRKPFLALDVFCWMQKQKGRLKPGRHVYSTVIAMLGRAGMLSQAREIFDSEQVQSLGSVRLYNSMMGAYVKIGNFKRAWKLYEDMCKNGLAADEVTFNTLLSGISRADMPLEMAEKLFSKMKLVGITPGHYTYNALITNFSRSGNLQGAAAILEEMRSGNKMPDLCTFNTVISMYGQAGKHEEALQVFNTLKAAGFDPNTVTYTNLIQMFSQARDLKAALAQYSEMQRAGCMPDVMTYSLMVHVYGKAGLATEAEQVFKEMQQAGFEPNLVTWSSLIQVYAKNGMLKKACSCFAEMQNCGCQPDALLFNIMLTSYKEAALPVHAASLFRQMQAQGIAPDATSFNILIHIFSQSGQAEDAKSLYQQMIRVGFTPDKLSRRFLNKSPSNKSPSNRAKCRNSFNSHKIHSAQSL